MRINLQRGFTLVETLFYAVGVALLLGVIVTMLYYALGWYRYATVSPRVDAAGSLIVDRIEDDLRAGLSLNSSQDTFNVALGSIGVNALDSSKNPVTYYYAVQSGKIVYQKNSGATQTISPSDLYVSRLQFNELDSADSKAIHFTVGIDYPIPTGGGTTTNTYSGLAIMRNSYQ
jgi:hypothetical protein